MTQRLKNVVIGSQLIGHLVDFSGDGKRYASNTDHSLLDSDVSITHMMHLVSTVSSPIAIVSSFFSTFAVSRPQLTKLLTPSDINITAGDVWLSCPRRRAVADGHQLASLSYVSHNIRNCITVSAQCNIVYTCNYHNKKPLVSIQSLNFRTIGNSPSLDTNMSCMSCSHFLELNPSAKPMSKRWTSNATTTVQNVGRYGNCGVLAQIA